MEMGEVEFYETTPRTFTNKLRGYRRKEEALVRDGWEQTRAITLAVMRPNLDKRYSKRSNEQLWPFSWDKDQKEIEDPAEAFKRSKALWAEIDKKRNANKTEIH